MFDFPCNWKAGFIMDPTHKQRVGYLLSMKGLDLGGDQLAQDIEVFSPWNPDSTNYSKVSMQGDGKEKVVCTGVIEHMSFAGGVGDPICISAYISGENASLLSAKQKTALTTTKIDALEWWIANFDEENKTWYEEGYPKDPETLKAQLNATGGGEVRLSVASEPTKISSTVDVNVFNLYIEVVPAADATYALHFATDSKKQFIRNWGLKIGTQAAAAMGG